MSTNPVDNPELLDQAFEKGVHALGEIVYYFQQLEDEIRKIVAFLVNREEFDIGRAVSCEMSFKQLLHMASCLPDYFYVRDRQQFESRWHELLKEAGRAEELRNALLHSTFGVSWSDEPVFVRSKNTAKMGKGFREGGEALSPEVMAGYRQQISGIAIQLADFFSKEFPGWRTRDWHPKWDKP